MHGRRGPVVAAMLAAVALLAAGCGASPRVVREVKARDNAQLSLGQQASAAAGTSGAGGQAAAATASGGNSAGPAAAATASGGRTAAAGRAAGPAGAVQA